MAGGEEIAGVVLSFAVASSEVVERQAVSLFSVIGRAIETGEPVARIDAPPGRWTNPVGAVFIAHA